MKSRERAWFTFTCAWGAMLLAGGAAEGFANGVWWAGGMAAGGAVILGAWAIGAGMPPRDGA